MHRITHVAVIERSPFCAMPPACQPSVIGYRPEKPFDARGTRSQGGEPALRNTFWSARRDVSALTRPRDAFVTFRLASVRHQPVQAASNDGSNRVVPGAAR